FGGAQDTGTPQQSASQSRVYNDQTQGDGPFTYSDNLTNANQSIRYIGFGRNIWDNTNTDIGPDINLIPAGGVNGQFFNFNDMAVSTVAPPAGQSTRIVIVNGNGAANAQQTGASGKALFESTNAGIAATTGAIVYTQINTGAGWNGVNTFFGIAAIA